MIIGIILFCVGFALLAWKNLEWALLALGLLLPAYLIRFNLGLPLTLLEAMILIVFAVWFIKNYSGLRGHWSSLFKGEKKPAVRQYPFRWAMVAWLVVSFASAGVSGWSLASLGVWRAYFFEPVLLFIVVVNVFNTKEKLVRLLGALGISAGVISVFAVYQYITGDYIPNSFWAGVEGRRATSFFPYPNAVGLYAAPILFLLLGALYAAWDKTKKFFSWQVLGWLLGIILCLAAIVAAKSEGAAFGAAAGLAIFGLLANRRVRLITLGILAAAFLVLVFNMPLRNYVKERVTLHNFSGEVRRTQWKETLIMLRDGRELSGAGLANYQSAVKPYHQEGIFYNRDNDPEFQRKVVFNEEYRKKVWQPLEIYLYPHNVILNFWSELGLVGVVVFFWLVVLFFYYGFSAWRKAVREGDRFSYVILGVTISLLVTLIHGLVDVPYFKNDLAALFWLIMGLMAVIRIWKK